MKRVFYSTCVVLIAILVARVAVAQQWEYAIYRVNESSGFCRWEDMRDSFHGSDQIECWTHLGVYDPANPKPTNTQTVPRLNE